MLEKQSTRRNFLQLFGLSAGATLISSNTLAGIIDETEIKKLNPKQQEFMIRYGKWMDDFIEVIRIKKADPENKDNKNKMLALTEAELISRVRADLKDLLGIERPPLFAVLSRWENSMPQYHVGHVDRVKRIQERVASLPGLALAGNAYSGVGIPDCIRSGEAAADDLIDALSAND